MVEVVIALLVKQTVEYKNMAKWVNAPQRKHNAVCMFCKWCRGRRSFATVVKERENAAVRDKSFY